MALTQTKRKAKKATKAKAAKKKVPAKRKAAKPAAAKKAPAAYTPPTGPGSFCWNELMTSDVSGATAFYGSLFGWKVEDAGMGSMPYSFWQRGAQGVGAVMPLPEPHVPTSWMTYVEVADVDAVAAKASSLGGQVLKAPMDIPNDHGRCAILKDPQGAVFGVYAMPKA